MAKQTFTTGQVLTAAQMTSLQQTAMGGGSTTAKTTSYVLLAADAGTVVQMNAAGATTITVNTALFAAGDSVQIQNIGAGVCTVTAGTATVTTAGSLALSQWEGGQLYFSSTSASIFFDIVQATGMTNPLTTTGDTIYSSSGTTPARLGIGTTSQVLTVAGGIPSWATPAVSASGMTLIKRAAFSAVAGTSTTFDGVFTSTYKSYMAVVEYVEAGTYTDDLQLQLIYSGTTKAATYYGTTVYSTHVGGPTNLPSNNTAQFTMANETQMAGVVYFNKVGNTSQTAAIYGVGQNMAGYGPLWWGCAQDNAQLYTGFLLKSSSSTITGTVAVYGLATA